MHGAVGTCQTEELRARKIRLAVDYPGSQHFRSSLHPPSLEDKAALLSFYFYPPHMSTLMVDKRDPFLSPETERWARFPLSVSPLV